VNLPCTPRYMRVATRASLGTSDQHNLRTLPRDLIKAGEICVLYGEDFTITEHHQGVPYKDIHGGTQYYCPDSLFKKKGYVGQLF
jgi:hypothetical protein